MHEGARTPRALGKFFFLGEEKFFLRGVSYGPFAPASHGTQFPERDMVRRDFALMRDMRASTASAPLPRPRSGSSTWPPRTISWCSPACPGPSTCASSTSPGWPSDIRKDVAEAVKRCKDHPAIFALLIGNEIPADIVRWHGPERSAGVPARPLRPQ